ncbi:glycosyltransferase [Yanshouia hominis]|uniref:Glycosyltransferase n=1 Tax=Yanshouia hominis TaxID=2763673 RepID=A0ABR7NLU9_9FIRM|nr:glycosyltransferase [Yanshouia hominis]MBC8577359.1 glycosyltransferase [Yanshouia hominis]
MRIAIFVETYLPYLNGVVTHVKILREGLIHNGHEVLIVTADKTVKEHVLEDGVLRCPALEVKKIYGYGLSSPISLTLMKRIKEFRPDVIHIQQEFSIGLAGVRAARALHLPLIYTLHTMYDDYIYYIAPGPLTGIARRVSHNYVRFIARRADIVTSPSKKCLDYLSNAGVHRKVYVIPNSVELDDYSETATTPEQRAAIRERYHIPADAFVACFCGRIGKEKGVDNLIKLWHAQCGGDPSLYLMIIGEGPFRKELEALAQSYGLGGRIIFTGAVPHEQISPYYACCNAYATASLSEMYSISMLEAQASGLPVVQWLDPDNIDQIKVGVNGYLFETAEEFGRIIHQLADVTPEQRVELAKRVRDSVKERSSDSIANYLLDLYQQAINKHR